MLDRREDRRVKLLVSDPIAEDGLHDEHGEIVWRTPANTLDGNGNVGSGDFVVAYADF